MRQPLLSLPIILLAMSPANMPMIIEPIISLWGGKIVD